MELEAAKRVVSAKLGVKEHKTAEIDLRLFGGSGADGRHLPFPKAARQEAMGEGIPLTYVPARNTIFLSFALAWAEVLFGS